MRAIGWKWQGGMAMVTLCALLLAVPALRAQPGSNPLRNNPPAAAPLVAPPKASQSAPPASASSSPAPLPRRFTEYDIWGENDAQSAPGGLNPLHQLQMAEEFPTPAALTPQQAISEEEWATLGPKNGAAQNHALGDFFSHAWFIHTDPNDPHRSIGWGEPLVGTSWRNRPWYLGAFIGGIFNGDLISGHVEQSNTALAGARLGYDFDHYWGLEARFGYSNPYLSQPDGIRLGVSRNYLTDLELLYYPWGDSRWRPYITCGVGMATFRFTDDRNRVIHESLLSVPLGVGLKYYYAPWFTFRFDLVDNFAFGSRTLDNQANVSLMAGVEYRFGGPRPSYFPWHGNTVGW